MPVGQLYIGKLPDGQMSIGQLPDGQMSVGQMVSDQKMWDHRAITSFMKGQHVLSNAYRDIG